MSDSTPTYDGSVRNTALASGCAASASATRCGGIPPGRPVRGSSSGRTNTGCRPPSTKAENSERWIVRDTITVAPGRATPSAIAWLAWLEPFTMKRHQSAPQARAARRLGGGQHALALAQVVDRAGQRQVECQERIRHGGVAAVARSRE